MKRSFQEILDPPTSRNRWASDPIEWKSSTICSFPEKQYSYLLGLVIDHQEKYLFLSGMTHILKIEISTGQHEIFVGTNEQGFEDGIGSDAQFDHIVGMRKTNKDEILVADFGNNSIRKVNIQTRKVETIRLKTPLYGPVDVATDGKGIIYVVEQHRGGTIRKIDPNTLNVQLVVGSGKKDPSARDGNFMNASFVDLNGMVLDQNMGDIYVTDNRNIRKISQERNEVTTLNFPIEHLINDPFWQSVQILANGNLVASAELAGLVLFDMERNLVSKIAEGNVWGAVCDQWGKIYLSANPHVIRLCM